jgi:hypothetical protein
MPASIVKNVFINAVPLNSFRASDTFPSESSMIIKKVKMDAEYINIPPKLSFKANIPILSPV